MGCRSRGADGRVLFEDFMGWFPKQLKNREVGLDAHAWCDLSLIVAVLSYLTLFSSLPVSTSNCWHRGFSSGEYHDSAGYTWGCCLGLGDGWSRLESFTAFRPSSCHVCFNKRKKHEKILYFLGSGPQDLGQYVISHMSPCDRRLGRLLTARMTLLICSTKYLFPQLK